MTKAEQLIERILNGETPANVLSPRHVQMAINEARDKSLAIDRHVQLLLCETYEQAEAQSYFGPGLRASDKPPTKVGDRVKVLDGPNKGRLGDVVRFEPEGWYAWVDVEGSGGKLVKYHVKDLRKQ